MAKASKPTAYRALVGLNYPVAGEDRRAEPGDVVTDLPTQSIPWLVDGGLIEPVADAAAPAPEDGE